ncbi:MAG: ribonuclease III, partial [Candidatus Dormibacteraceae bacterium]
MKDPAEIERRLADLQTKIGIAFKHPALLQEALSHSSFANENPSISPHDNERLEYLGDAVLQLISAEYLFKGRPLAAEGEMTQVRSSMVNTQALALLSEDLGMGEFLLLGKGIARGGGRNLRSLLANAFEAVLGAIFLDQGYDAAYHYCMERFRALPEADVQENFKGRLQRLVQERFGVTPAYDSIGARAQSGRVREYTAVVYAGGDPLGTGHGRTKQVAEQTAAKEAIRKLVGEVAALTPAALPVAKETAARPLAPTGVAVAPPAAPAPARETEAEQVAPAPVKLEPELAPAAAPASVDPGIAPASPVVDEARSEREAGGWRGRRQ